MKLWIARNEKSSYCTLFLGEKPHQYVDEYSKETCWCITFMWGTYMLLPNGAFPEVTFENSPMEVELKLIEK